MGDNSQKFNSNVNFELGILIIFPPWPNINVFQREEDSLDLMKMMVGYLFVINSQTYFFFPLIDVTHCT